eukprot:TRINITY_DN749_c0_g1_i1.p1 TRINITY_DN749_c0_g1~~TRINITY_DN749_c0_g1_i1.p1  ORF type:complete len:670 (+),score=204.92 TRINITY_DN749_c0_g1_i1:121-2130(+)
MQVLLLLEDRSSSVPQSPNVVCLRSGTQTRQVDRAGERFQRYCYAKLYPQQYDYHGQKKIIQNNNNNNNNRNNNNKQAQNNENTLDFTVDSDDENDESASEWRRKKEERERNRKNNQSHNKNQRNKHDEEYDSDDEDDLYFLLGIKGEGRWSVSDDDLKKAYKKLTLQYHPDKIDRERQKKGQQKDHPHGHAHGPEKTKGGLTEEEDAHFKKIKAAWETLSDPQKRRVYDSRVNKLDQYERVESFDPTTQNFFQVFERPFRITSRWAIDKPVPQLGGPNDRYDSVTRFYDYWFHFRSWRDFSYYDEYETDQAESRDEKRWMERNNEKQRAKRKKEETTRILNFVELAFKYDPRIKRHKESQKLEKQKQRDAKIEKERREQEEAELRRQREEQAKKEEADRQREEKKKEMKVTRKTRTRLRNLCRQNTDAGPSTTYMFGSEGGPSLENVEYLCGTLTLPKLQSLCTALEQSSSPSHARQVFDAELKRLRDEVEAKSEKFLTKSSAEERAEVEQLGKEVWTDEELSLLAKGLAKYPGGLNNRWQAISEMIGTRTVKEVVAKVKTARTQADLGKSEFKEDAFTKFKNKREHIITIKDAPSSRWVDPETGKPLPEPIEDTPSSSDDSTPETPTTQPAAQSTPAATTPASTSTPAPKDSAEDWTNEEQKALEKL